MTQEIKTRVERITLFFIVPLGFLLRALLLIQNRNLIIDEANIVRNVHERSWFELTQHLSYEQYAPIPFLWLLKFISLPFGLDEIPMRIPSFLFGFAALFLFYKLLKKTLSIESVWYPLIFFSVSFTFLFYSASVKQYSSDLFITIFLMYYAVSKPSLRSKLEVIQLLLIGILSVLCAMPALIIFPALLAFYFLHEEKNRVPVFLVSLAWAAFAAGYYFKVIAPLIYLPNLQQAHADFFLTMPPRTLQDWIHNYHAVFTFIDIPTGYTVLANGWHLFLLGLGFVSLWKNNKAMLALLSLPIGITLVLSGLHKYSLAPRLLHFVYPCVLMLIGYGLHSLYHCLWPKYKTWLIPILAILLICISNQFPYHLFQKKYEMHSITEGLNFLKEHHIKPHQVYCYNNNNDSYRYYTEIHSNQSAYQSLLGIHLTTWNQRYDTLQLAPSDTAYFLATGNIAPHDLERIRTELHSRFNVTIVHQSPYSEVFAFYNK